MSIDATSGAVYTTTDWSWTMSGKLHIAKDTNYSGDISCYWGVRAWIYSLLGWATQVVISQKQKNGKPHFKVRYLDNADYASFLRNQTRGPNSISNSSIRQHRDLRQIEILANRTSRTMLGSISRLKSFKLFKKMVQALITNDFASATKYALKGANPNNHFYLRDHYGLSFTSYEEGVPFTQTEFHARTFTPLLYAADAGTRGNEFCRTLRKLHAVENAQGRSVTFKRVRLSSTREERNRTVDTQREGIRMQAHTGQIDPHRQEVIHTIIYETYQDIITPREDFIFDGSSLTAKHVPSSAPPKTMPPVIRISESFTSPIS